MKTLIKTLFSSLIVSLLLTGSVSAFATTQSNDSSARFSRPTHEPLLRREETNRIPQVDARRAQIEPEREIRRQKVREQATRATHNN